MNPLVQPARLSSSDKQQVYTLFRRLQYRHLHLDWRTLDEWLRSPMLHCWVTRREARIESLLGATIQPARTTAPWGFENVKIAWLRFILPSNPFGQGIDLDSLWTELYSELKTNQVTRVAVLAMEPWVGKIVSRWGFEQKTSVITLRRPSQQRIEIDKELSVYTIRSAKSEDMDAIISIDARAFDPIWQYSADTLRIAASQAVSFTVLCSREETLGYQLSTLHSGSGHLARLAVLPDAQGKGFGKALVNYSLQDFFQRNIYTITVNTQKHNTRSQHVYQRLGFNSIGHEVPVWELILNEEP